MGSNAMVEMKSGKGYSDGEKGDLRNQLYTVSMLHFFFARGRQLIRALHFLNSKKE